MDIGASIRVEKEGRQEGLAEGEKLGEERLRNEKEKMAKAMKQKGMDTATISEISGLSLEPVENL